MEREEQRGWGTSGPAIRGVPWIRSTLVYRETRCELGYWAGSGKPWPWAGEGRLAGEGGAATRTSVAFIHLAAPIHAPVTHPRLHRCLPQGLRVSRPCFELGAGCSGTLLQELWHPGRCIPSIQPLELGGGTEGAGDPGEAFPDR